MAKVLTPAGDKRKEEEMKNLKENSICINGTIIACWPQYGEKDEPVDMTDIGSKFNGCYATNNSTICYVHNHQIFVTPYTREAMRTIEDAGLVRKSFYVPFSNWDYPKYEKTKWERLRKAAREALYRDYENDCTKWCDEHAIAIISDDILKRCFKMPRKGVPVKHPHFESVYYPVCNECCMDCTVIDKLGRYHANNGKVVFVGHDGHTYIAKGYWILDELRQAGYRESELFVPLSNGEQITDPYLAAQWEQVSKK